MNLDSMMGWIVKFARCHQAIPSRPGRKWFKSLNLSRGGGGGEEEEADEEDMAKKQGLVDLEEAEGETYRAQDGVAETGGDEGEGHGHIDHDARRRRRRRIDPSSTEPHRKGEEELVGWNGEGGRGDGDGGIAEEQEEEEEEEAG
ncbi:hypothetical protein CBR_g22061 [Chara braunii]|uniref:Uncharacterized protein n=1 Tax=Chara braunii TaxID=69332 RepID=A0A388L288_CHABU|nr:hypothetical protein CBR_g22061 [Chara braunii]|eukprot:GBG76313.1 hypothetical protein CBR_g22061 [Chara braunii]